MLLFLKGLLLLVLLLLSSLQLLLKGLLLLVLLLLSSLQLLLKGLLLLVLLLLSSLQLLLKGLLLLALLLLKGLLLFNQRLLLFLHTLCFVFNILHPFIHFDKLFLCLCHFTRKSFSCLSLSLQLPNLTVKYDSLCLHIFNITTNIAHKTIITVNMCFHLLHITFIFVDTIIDLVYVFGSSQFPFSTFPCITETVLCTRRRANITCLNFGVHACV